MLNIDHVAITTYQYLTMKLFHPINKYRLLLTLLLFILFPIPARAALEMTPKDIENAKKGKQIVENHLLQAWASKCKFLFMYDELPYYVGYEVRPEMKTAHCLTTLDQMEYGERKPHYVLIAIDSKNDTFEIHRIPALNMLLAVPIDEPGRVKDFWKEVEHTYQTFSKNMKIKVLRDDLGFSTPEKNSKQLTTDNESKKPPEAIHAVSSSPNSLAMSAVSTFYNAIGDQNYSLAWNALTKKSQDTFVAMVAEDEKLSTDKVRDLFERNTSSIKVGFWRSFRKSSKLDFYASGASYKVIKESADQAVVEMTSGDFTLESKAFKENGVWKMGYVETFLPDEAKVGNK